MNLMHKKKEKCNIGGQKSNKNKEKEMETKRNTDNVIEKKKAGQTDRQGRRVDTLFSSCP